MNKPSQSAPPEEFIRAWKVAHHFGAVTCAHDAHLLKVETEAAWFDGSLGTIWRAAFAAGAAAQAEKDARIAEGVLDLRISDGDQALDRVIEAIRAAVGVKP